MKNQSYHIVFDKEYYFPKNNFGQRNNQHPSWTLKPFEETELMFGGLIKNKLNRLIEFDKSFLANGQELKNQSFGINFKDFFNVQINGENLFYRHLENGEIERINKTIKIGIDYSNHPLKETKIKVVKTPESLLNQEWEGNCNKIGGNPIWVQKPEFLTCPSCKKEMTFIFQLDSGIPDLNANNNYEIMFGNDGVCYTFWCNEHKISGYLWQST
ncbi:DUF1963 domain-containing protein [Psychroserpens sp. NJDZ02]|uniref:DUF1963 domain-containing protein n=1 Tax=Psychroserpens sp. NJDZ02 TaxID=2570561 RepID=UPI0010A7D749|nr:DUF1963 domain-containing protein [Psychroserpens sp. NJDZ02]QCE42530.1 DUF1963 domain-containing protein [Psychroserpens sp. NJDZ02]